MKKLLEKMIERLLKKADNLSSSIDATEDDSAMQAKINDLQGKVDFFKAITKAPAGKNEDSCEEQSSNEDVNEPQEAKKASRPKKSNKRSKKGKSRR